MVKKLLKYLGLMSLILSYGVLLWNMGAQGFPLGFTPHFTIVWLLGPVSLVANGVYAVLVDFDEYALSVFGCCGLVWFFPFFMTADPFYHLIPLVVFLILGIYLHIKY